MRYLLNILLMIILCTTVVIADGHSDISSMLQNKIDAIMSTLQDKSLERYHRDQKIKEIIAPIFSYQTMAKLSLGKKHWSALSEEQRNEFSSLFIKRIQQSYLEKLDIYTNEKVTYQSPVFKGKQVHIPTSLISKDNHIEILYKFFKSGEDWKIYDVEIGGVSVIQTYRSQFDGILKEGSIEKLLQQLRSDSTASIFNSNIGRG